MSPRFTIIDTPLQRLKLIQRNLIGDHRGYIERLYSKELRSLIPGKHIIQIIYSMTAKRGAVRGLHFQYPPHAETKIVSRVHGEVFDVAVDVRRYSLTFLYWHAEMLSASNHNIVLIPEGFAQGFQTLTEDCELFYFHTAPHHPDAKCGLNVQDPRLSIKWPEAVIGLSSRDATHSILTREFHGEVV